MATPNQQPPIAGQPVMMQPGQPVMMMQPGQPVMMQPGQPMMMQPGQAMVAPPPGQPVMMVMPTPAPIEGVPAGLEYLSQLDQLLVKQTMEVLEMFTGFETSNKYKVQNSLGQECYKAVEESDFCSRQFCGPSRSFKVHIKDHTGRSVIEVERPFVCAVLPCLSSCRFEMTVKAPLTGEILGVVKQEFFCCEPKFSVYDKDDNKVFIINGPCIQCGCGDIEFAINDIHGNKCGAVTKKWSGILKEAYTDADNFNLSFPLDLDVKLKATLLGAVFMIDFMFYETQQNNN